MYRNLVANNIPGAPISVHLTDFPSARAELIDPELEKEMDEVIRAVQLGRACRNAASIKVRQPAQALYVKGSALSEGMAALIADELNVKEVRFVTDARAFTTYKIKPQMRTVGPKYGKLLKKIGEHLLTLDGNQVVDGFEKGEALRFEIEGSEVVLSKEDVLTEPMQKAGFVAQTEGELTVVLDTNLTQALIEEGFVREVISKLQTMRKEAGFEVTDRIGAAYQAGEKLSAVIEKAKGEIMGAVLATELVPGSHDGVSKEWNINGEDAVLTVWVNAQA